MAEDDAEEKGPVQATLDDDGGIDGDDPEAGEGGGGFNAKKIILFVVLPLFIFMGVGGGLYFTGTFGKMFGAKDEQHAAKDSHGEKSDGGEHGEKYATSAYFLEIPNMSVTLSSTGSQPRYLRLSVQLELDSAEDVAAVEAVMPRIIDQFQTYLRELRVKDLRGSQGIYRLQMELLARVNAAAYPVEVQDVLFQEILIQ